MAIPIPIPTRAARAADKKNGEATSSSPFQSLFQGDEDVATPCWQSPQPIGIGLAQFTFQRPS
jgi:hypothetical protein